MGRVQTPSMKERASKTAWGVLGLLGQLCGGPLSGDLARSFENEVDLAPSPPTASDQDPESKAEEVHRRLITKSSELSSTPFFLKKK